ncbi:hypothetical protein [Algoriphagus litoralis]|uniref:hypothetical protein n=1 Tax=Algoriphagus litoralis TaxID=2202829 RepID=UPI000DB921E9|nr:hypothetical protein [Algoriphagus litoralis]
MKKIELPLVLVLFALIGCQEEEKPDSQYGIYLVESISTAIPVDFTNSGEQTIEHDANFPLCGPSGFSIAWRMNKQTPVMDFDTFTFSELRDKSTNEVEIIRGCGITRRIVELKENGELELKFFGDVGVWSTNPKQIDFQFEIRSLTYFPDEKTIRMDTYQQLYDFFLEEYVETEVTYIFSYEGPFNPFPI